jgi:hypothetical protein
MCESVAPDSILCASALCARPTEAVVRGHKSGLLTVPDYNNLSQCETLEDIKLNLVRDDERRRELGRGRSLGPAPEHTLLSGETWFQITWHACMHEAAQSIGPP